jgi:ribonuclease BN (tRNA processing enzyme)
MRIELLGVRGSTPAPGSAFVRYGGHTSCVAIGADDGPPRLVLDAGTGIRRLPQLLGDAPFIGSILLTHLHWDHTQGLPFCPSIDRDDAEVDLWVPSQRGGPGEDEEPAALFARAMSPPHFPIDPSGLRGRWRFHKLDVGAHRIGDLNVTVDDIPHKGGRTFGFRITDNVSTTAYMPDHGPIALGPGPDGWGELHATALALAKGVDLLLHDAQHTVEEFPARAHFGHCPADYAVSLGLAADVGTVVLFHHDPARTDDELDALVGRLRAAAGKHGLRVVAGAEQDVFSGFRRDRDGRGTPGGPGPARGDRDDRS